MDQTPVGLVTGFEPFAGLPSNPSARVLPALDGLELQGIRVVARVLPVSLARVPAMLADLVREHRPAFVMGLGLAAGASVVRVETVAINAAHLSVPDNDGARPAGGGAFAPEGPAARTATWDGVAIVADLLAAGIPARLSFHAGTHLCNFTLYTSLGLLEAEGLDAPCGFLHLPCLPDEVVWLMRGGSGRNSTAGAAQDTPSMAFTMQVAAVTAAARALAGQARARLDARQASGQA